MNLRTLLTWAWRSLHTLGLTLSHVAGVVAVRGRVKVVAVASAAGVRERLTESGPVVEIPALNPLAAVTLVHLQVTFLDVRRIHYLHCR